MTNRTGLVKAVTARLGSKTQADVAVAAIEAEIISSLARGERVRLASIGTFEPERVPKRVVRNPRTGKTMDAEPTARVRFRASAALKAAISDAPAQTAEGNAA